MAQFVNAKEAIVTEAIDGLIAASGGKLARLDGSTWPSGDQGWQIEFTSVPEHH